MPALGALLPGIFLTADWGERAPCGAALLGPHLPQQSEPQLYVSSGR